MHTKKLQRITNTAAGPRLATASTPRAIHPRHCRSAASARREEVAQAWDTAGQCRSTRKARRSRLPHAAVCAHARMCFWDSTHLHACFHSPKSSIEARKNLVGMLNPGTARTPSHPIEFKKFTTRTAATARWTLGRKNQLPPPNQSNSSKKRNKRRNQLKNSPRTTAPYRARHPRTPDRALKPVPPPQQNWPEPLEAAALEPRNDEKSQEEAQKGAIFRGDCEPPTPACGSRAGESVGRGVK